MHSSLDKCLTRRTGRRLSSGALALIATLMLPATALAAAFRLTPHIANHAPIVNKLWPIRIDVTRGATKLSGSVSYDFLFSGSVVSTQKGHSFTKGVYRDSLLFPPKSTGVPLTLRIVVTTRFGTEHIDWKVTAHT